jgi:hypothetical protein
VETTADGWTVSNVRFFHHVIGHPAPRPWSYWDQIKEDAGSWKVWRIWLSALVPLGIGAVTGLWFVSLFGVFSAYVWVRLCRGAVRMTRNCGTGTGIVGSIRPHPIVPTVFFVGDAALPEGGTASIAIEIRLAAEVKRLGFPVEVLFASTPGWQYGTVLAIKAI